MYVRVSLYKVCKRAQACLVRQASHSKTALENAMDGPTASRHHRTSRAKEIQPPPKGSYAIPDTSDSDPDSGLTPTQIQIGSEAHGYIYNRIRGHIYRCCRGPDDDRLNSRIWLRRTCGVSNHLGKWVALVIIGYGTLLVSQRTGAAYHTRCVWPHFWEHAAHWNSIMAMNAAAHQWTASIDVSRVHAL